MCFFQQKSTYEKRSSFEAPLRLFFSVGICGFHRIFQFLLKL